MHELIGSFLSNESPFGRLMSRIGIIIVANLLFILCSLPVITMGASLCAMYHVMLKALRSGGQINPFKQFFLGFRDNFRQSTLSWILLILLAVFGYVDIQICRQAGGFIYQMRFAIYAIGLIVLMTAIYLFPVMAAFKNTLPNLIRSAVYYAVKNPGRLLVLLFFHVFPLYLTYSDPQMMPLYAFIWFVCGFGAIAMLTARLLIRDFEKHLPLVDAYGDFILDENNMPMMPGSDTSSTAEWHEKTEDEILEEMKKLDM